MTARIRNSLAAVAVMLLLLLPLVAGNFYVSLFNTIGIATLVTLGLVVLTGCGGLVSFGQAAFVGIGAYSTAWATTTLGLSPWLGLALALALTGAVGLLLGTITLHLGGHYLPLTTIAWGNRAVLRLRQCRGARPQRAASPASPRRSSSATPSIAWRACII